MDVTTLYSESAEMACMGAVITGQYLTVQRIIDATDLWLERHRLIFATAQNIWSQYGDVNLMLLSDTMHANKTLDAIGGRSYLMALVNALDSERHTEIYAHMVKRVAVRRKLHEYTDTLDARLQDDAPVNDIINEMIADLKSMSAPDIDDHVVNFDASLAMTFDIVEQHRELYQQNKQYTLGIRSGLHDLDKLLDGFRYGDVNVLAGYTGAGKSAAVFTIALNAATRGINRQSQHGARVMVFSGEMTQFAMNNRIMSMSTGIPVQTIERGAFSDEQYAKYVGGFSQMSQLPLRFKRTTRLNVDDLPSLVEQEIQRNGLDLLVLDGILQLDTSAHADQDWLRINTIMESLESVAIDYNISILATHQIGRSGADGKPSLSDLKRSSAVEEKSARVMLLWKPDENVPNEREIVVAKNRHGSPGVVPVYFNTNTTQFFSKQNSF